MHSYVASRFAYQRRQSIQVKAGDLSIGGNAPICVQSMCTTPTQDVEATIKQSIQLAEAGCEMVRITAPGIKDAEALGPIRKGLNTAGFQHIPLCADIHFMPKAAMIAVEHVEKVRINPGNFADKKSFAVLEYTDQEYQEELERIHERFTPLVKRAQELGRCLRIGSNHGSLSDRIMNRYGDTPHGMVESAMEFIHIAESINFQDIVISMKSSNPKVMIQAYRLLTARLYDHGCNYPLHLGVTEAGDGEDARVKSACGIGALLEEGIGDTIRVSLTEDPCAEIPVAQELADYYNNYSLPRIDSINTLDDQIDPFHFERRACTTTRINNLEIGGDHTVLVISADNAHAEKPDIASPINATVDGITLLSIDSDNPKITLLEHLKSIPDVTVIGVQKPGALGYLRAYRLLHLCILESHKQHNTPLHPIVLYLEELDNLLILSSICGNLLADGIGDAIYLNHSAVPCPWSYTILQAMKTRMTRADYVACPSCGRTLFDLMEVTADIKSITDHLDDVTIAIMGCIVNGPGEMADADFGYVGSGPGKITLYQGKTAVVKNIPTSEAQEQLIALIKSAGKWRERS